jgi:hypothetical protein
LHTAGVETGRFILAGGDRDRASQGPFAIRSILISARTPHVATTKEAFFQVVDKVQAAFTFGLRHVLMQYSSELVLAEGDIADVEHTLDGMLSHSLFGMLDFAGVGMMLLPALRLNLLSQTFRAVLEVFSPTGPLQDVLQSKQQLAFVQMCLESSAVFVELFSCRGEGVATRHVQKSVSALHTEVAAQLARRVESSVLTVEAAAEGTSPRLPPAGSDDGRAKTFDCLNESLLRAALRITPEQVFFRRRRALSRPPASSSMCEHHTCRTGYHAGWHSY